MAITSPEPISIRKMKRRQAPHVGVLAALLVLAAAASWAVWHGKDGDAGKTAEQPLSVDFRSLWQWTNAEFAGGARTADWSFRWDGDGNLADARKLASGLGLQLSGKLDGNTPIDVMASDPEGKTTLWVHTLPAGRLTEESDKSAYEFVLLLNAAENADYPAIATAVAGAERAIAQAGLAFQGGLTVKGTAAAPGADKRIAKAASAKEEEAYDDGHTSSLTYYSAALATRITSGAKPVNLQIAESPALAGKGDDLVVGMPLITGDYAQQAEGTD